MGRYLMFTASPRTAPASVGRRSSQRTPSAIRKSISTLVCHMRSSERVLSAMMRVASTATTGTTQRSASAAGPPSRRTDSREHPHRRDRHPHVQEQRDDPRRPVQRRRIGQHRERHVEERDQRRVDVVAMPLDVQVGARAHRLPRLEERQKVSLGLVRGRIGVLERVAGELRVEQREQRHRDKGDQAGGWVGAGAGRGG